MESSYFSWIFTFFDKKLIFTVISKNRYSATMCPKNMRESAFESDWTILFRKLIFISSKFVLPHLWCVFCVIEEKWRWRNLAKTKQKKWANQFFEIIWNFEGDDIVENKLYCGRKYFETILLSRKKIYVHIFICCWKIDVLIFRRLLNATLYVPGIIWWRKLVRSKALI